MAEIVQEWIWGLEETSCEHIEEDDTLKELFTDPTLSKYYQFCPICGRKFRTDKQKLVDVCSSCRTELIYQPTPLFCHKCGVVFD